MTLGALGWRQATASALGAAGPSCLCDVRAADGGGKNAPALDFLELSGVSNDSDSRPLRSFLSSGGRELNQ